MSHRYRAYPAPDQVETLVRHCADARFVWNLALEQINYWRPGRPSPPGPAERMRQLAEARQHTWLGEGSSSVQQQALRDFNQAMSNFFAGTHRRPSWRKKGINEGFCVRDVAVERLNRHWAAVFVPKLGKLRFRLSRPMPDAHGMARVTLDRAGRWHVSFAAPQAGLKRVPGGGGLGIDRGVATTLATSDGAMYRIPTLPKQLSRIAKLSARLARQHKGSKRRAGTKAAIAVAHARIADRRRDWIEKTTTCLVVHHDVVVLERLNTKSMLARPRPKPDPTTPGVYLPNGAAAKTGLNRGISSACWGAFERRLSDKASASGVAVVFVDPRYTSQRCRACGHTSTENRKSQAVFACVACGHTNHADLNAAANIAARGLPAPAHAPGPGVYARVSPAPLAAGTSGKAAA
jgi:putative transposase